MKRTNKANGIRSAVPRLTDYMRSSMGVIILALILAALSAVMTILGPNQIGRIATLMSDGLTGNIDLAAIAKVGIFLAVIYVLSAVFSFIQHYTMSVVTLKMSYRMRGELSAKINRVPQKYFGTTSQGDILSRITNDVSTLQQGLTNSLPTITSAATQFVGCLLMMFVTEWRLALVSIGVTILGMLLTVLILSRSQRYFAARQKSLGALNGYVEEMYSGHEVVRLSRAGRKIGAQFDTLNAAVYDANWRSQFLSGMMQPLMSIVGNIAYVAVCVLGSILAMNGTIEFGVIVSFILYVRLFTSPLTQMAQGMTNMQTASASAHCIFDGRMYTVSSAWFCRTPGSLRERCGRILYTTWRASPTNSSKRSAARAGSISSSIRCRRGSIRCSPRAPAFPPGRSSFSPSPALCSKMRPC